MEKRIKAYLLLTEEWLQDKGEKLHRNTKIYIFRLDKLFADINGMISEKA